MAKSTCSVASEFLNLNPATATEYKEVIGEFYANHRNKWLNIVMKKGVSKLDAEDIFSSAITTSIIRPSLLYLIFYILWKKAQRLIIDIVF